MKIYRVSVCDPAMDEHETHLFSNEQEALRCQKFLEKLSYYSMDKGFSFIYGVYDLDSNLYLER